MNKRQRSYTGTLLEVRGFHFFLELVEEFPTRPSTYRPGLATSRRID